MSIPIENIYYLLCYARNNKFYGFIINICYLIHENSLLSEKNGDWHFTNFLRDERKMNQLFEAFLRNFMRLNKKNLRSEEKILTGNFRRVTIKTYSFCR